MNKFYKKLGLKPLNKLLKIKLNKSLRKHFKISSIKYYNIIFDLFLFNSINKILNNKNQIVKIINKIKYIYNIGGVYKAYIKKSNNYYYKKIFIKECPIIPIINYNFVNIINNETIDYRYKYNINSSTNIELMCNYLLSKLVEDNITPHFPIFYGFNIVNMCKFTDKMDNLDIDNLNDLYGCLYKNKHNELFIQRYDVPCLLIYTEKIDNVLDLYLNKNIINLKEWNAIIFQLIAGLSVCQNYYNMYHNDLHIGNIMFNKTKVDFLYYKFNNKYFKIPTYNKIFKIIDWGRGVYDFNNYKVYNNVFNTNGEAFGQFIKGKINNTGLLSINFNNSVDLTVIALNLIYEKNFPKNNNIYLYLNNLISNKIKKKIKNYKNLESFTNYKIISKYAENSVPLKQINNNIFKKYIINKNKIPKNSKIYILF